VNAAWDFWMRSAFLDLNVESGAANEGIHIANCGMVWQMIVLGFAGMRSGLQADTLTLAPRLPAKWSRLQFPLLWKGTPVTITLTRSSTEIRNRGATELTASVWGESRGIPAGRAEAWMASPG
jgi:kojibiose phosphorylase